MGRTDGPVHGTGSYEVAGRVELGRKDLARVTGQLQYRSLEGARTRSSLDKGTTVVSRAGPGEGATRAQVGSLDELTTPAGVIGSRSLFGGHVV